VTRSPPWGGLAALAFPGLLVCLASAAVAASPWDMMFAAPGGCYHRDYSSAHLAGHPEQRVTGMTVTSSPGIPANPWPAVTLTVTLRGPAGGRAEAVAWCENIEDSLFCGMEGDAGSFSITKARGGAILLSAGHDGMSFETDTGFVTLEARRGDDRSFLLQPASGCR
jgi:hypothetical protein